MPAFSAIRTTALLAVLCALLLAAGCASSSGSGQASSTTAAPGKPEAESEAEDAIAIRVGPVVREPLSSLYATSATLRADKRAVVTARTRGVIQRLLVEEGDQVKEGQPLIYLENEEQKIGLDRTTTSLETKQREYERAKNLNDQGLMSEEDYETIRRDAEEARHAAALAELQLARTVIRAPFQGRILKRHLDVGATVDDGTALFDLADLDPLYADVGVPEREIGRLAPGQAVRLVADSSSESARAEIERIAPAVDPETGTIKVTLAVQGAVDLRPGSFVRVEIVTDTHADALVVPRSALVADGRRWHVFRLTEEGEHVERVEVVCGFEEQDRIEVLAAEGSEKSLTVGDRVVVVGASALTEGARIQVVEADEPEAGGEERVAT